MSTNNLLLVALIGVGGFLAYKSMHGPQYAPPGYGYAPAPAPVAPHDPPPSSPSNWEKGVAAAEKGMEILKAGKSIFDLFS